MARSTRYPLRRKGKAPVKEGKEEESPEQALASPKQSASRSRRATRSSRSKLPSNADSTGTDESLSLRSSVSKPQGRTLRSRGRSQKERPERAASAADPLDLEESFELLSTLGKSTPIKPADTPPSQKPAQLRSVRRKFRQQASSALPSDPLAATPSTLRSRRRTPGRPGKPETAQKDSMDEDDDLDPEHEFRVKDSQSMESRRLSDSQVHSISPTPPSNTQTHLSPTQTAGSHAGKDTDELGLEDSLVGDDALANLIADADGLDAMPYSPGRSDPAGRIPLDLTLSPITALNNSGSPHFSMSDDDRGFGSDSDLEFLESQSTLPSPDRVDARRQRNISRTQSHSPSSSSIRTRPQRKAAEIARNEMWLASHPSEVSTDARAWRVEHTHHPQRTVDPQEESMPDEDFSSPSEDDLGSDLEDSDVSSATGSPEALFSPSLSQSLSPPERSRRAQREMRDKALDLIWDNLAGNHTRPRRRAFPKKLVTPRRTPAARQKRPDGIAPTPIADIDPDTGASSSLPKESLSVEVEEPVAPPQKSNQRDSNYAQRFHTPAKRTTGYRKRRSSRPQAAQGKENMSPDSSSMPAVETPKSNLRRSSRRKRSQPLMERDVNRQRTLSDESESSQGSSSESEHSSQESDDEVQPEAGGKYRNKRRQQTSSRSGKGRARKKIKTVESHPHVQKLKRYFDEIDDTSLDTLFVIE